MSDTISQPPGSLIIIGQPPAELLETCFSEQTERTIVVEPDPKRADEMEARLAGATGVQVIRAAPWTGKLQPELTTFNFPGLRSLYTPSDSLKQLLPGLKARDKISVESISLKELTVQIGALRSPVHVVINLPGSEHRILNFWRRMGFLQKIAQLDLICGAEVFFRGSKRAAELQDLLTEVGFVLVFQKNEDPDWPRLTFHANMLKREVAALKKDLELRDVALAEVKAQLEEQSQAASTAQLQASETRTALAELHETLAARDAALEKAKAEAEAQEKAIATVEERASQAEAEIEQLRATLAENAQADSTGREETLQAKEDLSIALRMQSVLQADLSDLRQRFAESERQCRAQEELLSKLTPRLQQAAEQIRYLSLPGEGPEISGEAK